MNNKIIVTNNLNKYSFDEKCIADLIILIQEYGDYFTIYKNRLGIEKTLLPISLLPKVLRSPDDSVDWK